MEYLKIRDLKTAILKKMDISEKEKRAKVKEQLALPILIDLAILNKEEVVFGKNFSIAFSKNLLFKIAIPENLIEDFLEDDKIKIKVKTEFIQDKVLADTASNIYGYLHSYGKKTKKVKKSYTLEEREINKDNAKVRNKKKSLDSIVRMEEIFQSEDKILFFDIEAYERNQKIITEIGFVMVKNSKIIEKEHIIIKENYDFKNGRYVEDNKDNYLFGESISMSLPEALKIIESKIHESDTLIGHGIRNDFKYLSKEGIKIDKIKSTKKVVDTDTCSYLLGDSYQSLSIKNCLIERGIDSEGLHNAGNDAQYNYIIAKELISCKNTIELINNKNIIEETLKTKKTSKINIRN